MAKAKRVVAAPIDQVYALGNGRVSFEGRLFQICPLCSKTFETTDARLADFVWRYGCLNCRWRESDGEAPIDARPAIDLRVKEQLPLPAMNQ